MPNHWKTYKLGDLGNVQTGPFGSQLHQSDYVQDGTPLITVKNIGKNRITYNNLDKVKNEDVQRLKKFKLIANDIVFSRVGYVDRCAIIKKKEEGWLFSGSCLRLRINDGSSDPEFVSYYMSTESFKNYIVNHSVGATRPSLNTKLLSSAPIILPPLPEQRAIASILSALDDKIELNLQMNKTLEDMAMTLYKHWFVDFGPFKDGKFVESELGKIPEGWEVKSMGEVVNLKQGLAINKKTSHLLCEKSESSIPLFKIRDLLNDTVEHYVKKDEVPKQCIANESDLIFSRTGQVGHVFRWKNGCVHNNCFKVIPTNNLNTEYLFQFLSDPKFRQFANEIASGSVQKDLNHSTFKNIKLILPPFELQLKFDKVVSPSFLRTHENENENKILSNLRDTLLPKLISGEIRVKDAEKTIIEAL